MLADQHNWTPAQVDAMDPDFITELMAQKAARADYSVMHADDDPKKAEAKRKLWVVKRKVELMNRREKARGNGKP